MSEAGYNGWSNWGTWHLHMVLSNNEWLYELTLEWGEHLASLDYDPSWVEFAQGVDYLKEQVLELAEREQSEGWEHRWLGETLMEEGTLHIDWDYLARLFRDSYLEENPPHREPMAVFLSRDDDGWTWEVELNGEWAESLEVPLEPDSGDYDIHSSTLRTALEAAGYPMGHRHWRYTDGDYGPIGEWGPADADDEKATT